MEYFFFHFSPALKHQIFKIIFPKTNNIGGLIVGKHKTSKNPEQLLKTNQRPGKGTYVRIVGYKFNPNLENWHRFRELMISDQNWQISENVHNSAKIRDL